MAPYAGFRVVPGNIEKGLCPKCVHAPVQLHGLKAVLRLWAIPHKFDPSLCLLQLLMPRPGSGRRCLGPHLGPGEGPGRLGGGGSAHGLPGLDGLGPEGGLNGQPRGGQHGQSLALEVPPARRRPRHQAILRVRAGLQVPHLADLVLQQDFCPAAPALRPKAPLRGRRPLRPVSAKAPSHQPLQQGWATQLRHHGLGLRQPSSLLRLGLIQLAGGRRMHGLCIKVGQGLGLRDIKVRQGISPGDSTVLVCHSLGRDTLLEGSQSALGSNSLFWSWALAVVLLGSAHHIASLKMILLADGGSRLSQGRALTAFPEPIASTKTRIGQASQPSAPGSSSQASRHDLRVVHLICVACEGPASASNHAHVSCALLRLACCCVGSAICG